MSKWLLIDEYRVVISVPRDNPKIARRVQRILAGSTFYRRLQRVVRTLVGQTPALNGSRVRITR